jgi:O-antigen chain-terminating methyltransferase
MRAPPAALAAPQIDWLRFADRFRGTEEYVKEKQRLYVPHFQGCQNVLDLGCGRGEFLDLLKEAGISARGLDLDEECVALCRRKGLEAETADLFGYLADLPDGALDGIFCAQVIEHLPSERLPEMLRLASAKLVRGGRLVIETPNPESLAIFSTHFYLDPTHQRPIPPQLLVFYLEEFGLGQIRVERLSPPVESMSGLASLPEDFRSAFFGSLDYAVISRKLG